MNNLMTVEQFDNFLKNNGVKWSKFIQTERDSNFRQAEDSDIKTSMFKTLINGGYNVTIFISASECLIIEDKHIDGMEDSCFGIYKNLNSEWIKSQIKYNNPELINKMIANYQKEKLKIEERYIKELGKLAEVHANELKQLQELHSPVLSFTPDGNIKSN